MELVGGKCVCGEDLTLDIETGLCIRNEVCPSNYTLTSIDLVNGTSYQCRKCPIGCVGCELLSVTDDN